MHNFKTKHLHNKNKIFHYYQLCNGFKILFRPSKDSSGRFTIYDRKVFLKKKLNSCYIEHKTIKTLTNMLVCF